MSKPRINDINDAVIAGFSLDAIENNAIPMHNHQDDQIRLARKGLSHLREYVENILLTEGFQAKQDLILEMLDARHSMGLAWMEFDHEMQRELLKIRAIRGMTKSVDNIVRTLKKTAQEIKRDERQRMLVDAKRQQPWSEEPNEEVLNILDRKFVKMGGEYFPGEPKPTQLNTEIILRHDPRWKGRIRFCEFDGCTHIDEDPITDNEEMKMMSWIAKAYGFEMDPKKIGRIAAMIGQENPYHPIRDWLQSLEWDGKYRLHRFAIDILRSPDANLTNVIPNKLYPQFGRQAGENGMDIVSLYMCRAFIAAVARACEPGIKVDNMPILISDEQGKNKSQLVEVLVTRAKWFNDSSINIKTKDAYQQIAGRWFIEMAECDTLLNAEFRVVKSFLTSKCDRYRPVYGRHMVDQPRSCVFWGTTNEQQLEFLNDPSGSRRFWCFRVGDINLQQITDPDYLSQIWAEAYALYIRGEEHWLTDDIEHIYRDMLNKEFRKIDTWQEVVDGWLTQKVANMSNLISRDASKIVDGIEVVDFGKLWALPGLKVRCRYTISEILEGAVGLPKEKQSAKDIRRLTDILGRMNIPQIGRKRSGGLRVKTWQLDERYIRQAYRTLQLWQNEEENTLNQHQFDELHEL